MIRNVQVYDEFINGGISDIYLPNSGQSMDLGESGKLPQTGPQMQMRQVSIQFSFRTCDIIKGNESLVKNFNFHFLAPLSHNFKTLHFDANPITIGYLVTEL